MNKTKVVVAEAQYLIRLGLLKVLHSDKNFECVGECLDSSGLREILEKQHVDIITLDYSEEGFSMDDISYILQNYPDIKVLSISSDDDSDLIFKALELGVKNFLTKECGEDEVLKALIAASKGEKFICHKILDVIIDAQLSDKKNSNTKSLNLSVRELEIIQLIAQGFSAKEIASSLYLSLHTIYTHKKNIMKKLKLNTTSELILFAIHQGIAKPVSN